MSVTLPYQSNAALLTILCEMKVREILATLPTATDVFTRAQLSALIENFGLTAVVNATLNSTDKDVRDRCNRTAVEGGVTEVVFETLLLESITADYINSFPNIGRELLTLQKWTYQTTGDTTLPGSKPRLFTDVSDLDTKSAAATSSNNNIGRINTWGRGATNATGGKSRIVVTAADIVESAAIITRIRNAANWGATGQNDALVYDLYIGMIPPINDSNVSLYFPDACGISDAVLIDKLGDLSMSRTKIVNGQTVPILTLSFVLANSSTASTATTLPTPGVTNPSTTGADKSAFFTALQFCKRAGYNLSDIIKQIGGGITPNIIKDIGDVFGDSFKGLSFSQRVAFFETSLTNSSGVAVKTVTLANALRVLLPSDIVNLDNFINRELLKRAAGDATQYYYTGITSSTAGAEATGSYAPSADLLVKAGLVVTLKTPLTIATNAFGVTTIIPTGTEYTGLSDTFLKDFYFWKDLTLTTGNVYAYTTGVTFQEPLLRRIIDLIVTPENGDKLFFSSLGALQTAALAGAKLTTARSNFTSIITRRGSLKDALNTQNGDWNKITNESASASSPTSSVGVFTAATYASPLYLTLLSFAADADYEKYALEIMQYLASAQNRQASIVVMSTEPGRTAMYNGINKLVLWGAGPDGSALTAQQIMDVIGSDSVHIQTFLAAFSPATAAMATGTYASSLGNATTAQSAWAPFYPILRKLPLSTFERVGAMNSSNTATLSSNWALAFTDPQYGYVLKSKGAEIAELLTYTKRVRRYVNGALLSEITALAFDLLNPKFLESYGTTREAVLLAADKIDIQLV